MPRRLALFPGQTVVTPAGHGVALVMFVQFALDAGAALEKAGFTQVYNVLHGFEGELNEHHQRNSMTGWRHDGLPWEQC